MKYEVCPEGLKIFDKKEFNPEHILDCGQVFSYEKDGEEWLVYPQGELAKITEKEDFYLINTQNPKFFVNYFDLSTNYEQIKKQLSVFPLLKNSIQFGYGIRILNQDLFETIISFIISANNNIKRIKMILKGLRRALGKQIYGDIYSFPSQQDMRGKTEEFYKSLGAGYRAKYLVKVVEELSQIDYASWQTLPTKELRNNLISLSGIGPKVADCILLFGYHKVDVFPVDTWIHQMYNMFYNKEENREKIRNNLVEEYGDLSGYAQQYLFYYQRSGIA